MRLVLLQGVIIRHRLASLRSLVPSAQNPAKNPAKAGRMRDPFAGNSGSSRRCDGVGPSSSYALARKSQPQAMSPAWEARVASPQGDKPTVRYFRAAKSLPSKKVGADFPRWRGGQPFIIFVLRPLERLAITLVSPQYCNKQRLCNEQRRGKRTHVEIVSRKRGDILAAIKLRKNFEPRGFSSALFAWSASLPMCIGVNFSER